MNYKTIMLCAIVAGSMQSAWGMDEESADIQAAKANNKDEDYSLIIWIMTDKEGYNSIDRGCLAELAERTDSGDLKRRATECAGKFERAKKECINIGVNFATNPIFKDIAARMDSLIIVKTEQEAVRETLIRELKVAFIKGDIAKELDTAREIYLGKAWGMMRQERSNNKRQPHGGDLLNTSLKDDAFNAREFTKVDSINAELDLMESGSSVLIDAKRACDREGIDLSKTEAPEFTQVAQEYRQSLGTHQFKNPDSLALKINTALEAYRANKNANNNNNNNNRE